MRSGPVYEGIEDYKETGNDTHQLWRHYKFSLEDIQTTCQICQVLINIAASSVNTVDTMIRGLGDAFYLSPAGTGDGFC